MRPKLVSKASCTKGKYRVLLMVQGLTLEVHPSGNKQLAFKLSQMLPSVEIKQVDSQGNEKVYQNGKLLTITKKG